MVTNLIIVITGSYLLVMNSVRLHSPKQNDSPYGNSKAVSCDRWEEQNRMEKIKNEDRLASGCSSYFPYSFQQKGCFYYTVQVD